MNNPLATEMCSNDIYSKVKEHGVNTGNVLVEEWESFAKKQRLADILVIDLDLSSYGGLGGDVENSEVYQAFDKLNKQIEPFLNRGGVIIALYGDKTRIEPESGPGITNNLEAINNIYPLRVSDVRYSRRLDNDPNLEIKTINPLIKTYFDFVDSQPEYYLNLDEDDAPSDIEPQVLATIKDDPTAIAIEDWSSYSISEEEEIDDSEEDLKGHILLLPRPVTLDVYLGDFINTLFEIGNEYSNKEVPYLAETGSDEIAYPLEDAEEVKDDEEKRAQIQEQALREAEQTGCTHDERYKQVVSVQNMAGVGVPGLGSLQLSNSDLRVVCVHRDCHAAYDVEVVG